MTTASQFPSFATDPWYSDPKDHRCPHDAWLEACDVHEIAEGDRGQIRSTAITLRLLSSYHDGYIVFRYKGVESFALAAEDSARGMRDWLSDNFTPTETGLIRHEITWSVASSWRIEAREITYEWIAKASNETVE
jgi:hypothetical protein